jgi:hypothetical protein
MQAAWKFNMDMLHGHSTDMHGNTARTSSTDMQQGYAERTYSIDVQNGHQGHAEWTCSMEILHRHVEKT